MVSNRSCRPAADRQDDVAGHRRHFRTLRGNGGPRVVSTVTFNGSRWVSADGRWVWDRGQWQKAHPRRRRWLIVLIVAVVAIPILGVVSGVAHLSVATDPKPLPYIVAAPPTA